MNDSENPEVPERGNGGVKIIILLFLIPIAVGVVYQLWIAPSLEAKDLKKNENNATRTVLKFRTVQENSLLNGALRRYGSFQEMKPFLDDTLQSEIHDGYRFEVVYEKGSPGLYKIFASPLKPGVTGMYYFYTKSGDTLLQTEKPFHRDPISNSPLYPK